MSDQQPVVPEADPEPQGVPAIPENRDGILQMLCSMARSGLPLPLTLYVNGVIVSGTLIGQRTFLDKWLDQFTSWMGDETRASIRESFGLNEPEPDYTDMDSMDIQYIHLDEARVFAPGQVPLPANGMLWRGKIVDVNGFSYGAFQTAD